MRSAMVPIPALLLAAIAVGAAAISTIGTKSAIGSNGAGLNRLGLTVQGLVLISKVYPPPGDRATATVPTLPLAPERFSTRTDCPSVVCNPVAIRRARKSAEPPA